VSDVKGLNPGRGASTHLGVLKVVETCKLSVLLAMVLHMAA